MTQSLVNLLARHRPGRLALIPVVIACGAWSFASWFGTENAQDAGRMGSRWGWLSAATELAWVRLGDPGSADYRSAFHSLKNVGAEWVRLDPQRAFKALSFLLVVSSVLAGCVGFGLGVWVLA